MIDDTALLAGDAGVLPSDARAISQSLGAADKTLRLIPGSHDEDSRQTREAMADLLIEWVAGRR